MPDPIYARVADFPVSGTSILPAIIRRHSLKPITKDLPVLRRHSHGQQRHGLLL
jgi:hypothetical protein